MYKDLSFKYSSRLSTGRGPNGLWQRLRSGLSDWCPRRHSNIFPLTERLRVLVHFVARDCYFGDIKKMSKKKLDTATGNISVAAQIWCFRFVLNTTWDIWSVEGSDAGPRSWSCVLHVRQYCLKFLGAKSPRKHVSTVFRGNYVPSDR